MVKELTLVSRICSGVKVYCNVWSLFMSSSKLRLTSSEACGPLSSELRKLLSLDAVDEGESPSVGRGALVDSGDPRVGVVTAALLVLVCP